MSSTNNYAFRQTGPEMDNVDCCTDITVRSTDRRKKAWTNWKSYKPSLRSLVLYVFFISSLLMNSWIVPVFRRGFFCNDASIRYPHKPDTVGMKLLFTISLFLPAMIIKCCDTRVKKLYKEHIKDHPRRRRNLSDLLNKKIEDDVSGNEAENEELLASHSEEYTTDQQQLVVNEDPNDRESIKSEMTHSNGSHIDDDKFTHVSLNSNNSQDGDDLTAQLQKSYSDCQLFFFGYSTTMFFSGLGKITAGRLRPHFIARCEPSIACEPNIVTYVEEFTCTNDQLGPRGLSYISTSWPSGHAAVMFYSMLFTMIYLNSVMPAMIFIRSSHKLRYRFNQMLPYAAYALMIGLALFVSMTRVSDYHHHPTDVLSGSIIGFLIAILLSKYHANSKSRELLLSLSLSQDSE